MTDAMGRFCSSWVRGWKVAASPAVVAGSRSEPAALAGVGAHLGREGLLSLPY